MNRVRAEDRFEIERLEAGKYLLKHQRPAGNKEAVEWLLSCPDKGWFEAIPQGSTESLPGYG